MLGVGIAVILVIAGAASPANVVGFVIWLFLSAVTVGVHLGGGIGVLPALVAVLSGWVILWYRVERDRRKEQKESEQFLRGSTRQQVAGSTGWAPSLAQPIRRVPPLASRKNQPRRRGDSCDDGGDGGGDGGWGGCDGDGGGCGGGD